MASDFIHWKNGNAYFRRKVPKELQQALGRREWSQALKTGDKLVARERARALEVQSIREIEGALQRLPDLITQLDEAARQSGIPREMRECLMGHSNGTVNDEYGGTFGLEAWARAVSTINWPSGILANLKCLQSVSYPCR